MHISPDSAHRAARRARCADRASFVLLIVALVARYSTMSGALLGAPGLVLWSGEVSREGG